jgi:hypothetical protein
VNHIWVATLKHITHGPPLVLYLGCHSSNSLSISVSALLLHLSGLIYLSSCSCSPPFSCYCHLWPSYLNHEVLSFHRSSSSVPDPIMVQHYHHFWWTPKGKFKSWPNAHINIGGSYVIFVGGRRKLCNFYLVTSIGQGLTEDKVKPTEKGFFRGFWLILADGCSAVSCSEWAQKNYCHVLIVNLLM